MSDEPYSNVQMPQAVTSWLRLTVIFTVSFTLLTMIPYVLNYDETKSLIDIFLIFIVIWSIPSAFIAFMVKILPWFRERPSRFLIFPALIGGWYFYMTEIYFAKKIDITLPDQLGTVSYSQKSEMSIIESNYYYYRSIEFQNKNGSIVKVKMEPNMDHETSIKVSRFNGIIRFQDKYDTAWINTNNMCGMAKRSPRATLSNQKCQEDFSHITSWQELGVISDKSSDGLVLSEY